MVTMVYENGFECLFESEPKEASGLFYKGIANDAIFSWTEPT